MKNESLVQEGPIQQELSQTLAQIFQENDTDDVSPLTQWESHKCVMWGKLIQKATALKKNRLALFQNQLDLVASLERIHQKSLSQTVVEDLCLQHKRLA